MSQLSCLDVGYILGLTREGKYELMRYSSNRQNECHSVTISTREEQL